MAKSLKEVLMERDRITEEEAYSLISEAKLRVLDGEDPETVLEEEFQLEPDYVMDLLDFNE
jgi:hypothetical protein